MDRLKVGDQVVVISGNDKNRRGKITRILADRGLVVIEGINIVKRHTKASAQKPGGILEIEAPLAASKVMLIDPETNKPTRVRYEVKDGKKVRIAKSGAAVVTPQS